MSNPFNTKHRKRGANERRRRRYLRANLENADYEIKAAELAINRKEIDELFPKRKIILSSNSDKIITPKIRDKFNLGIELPGGIKQ